MLNLAMEAKNVTVGSWLAFFRIHRMLVFRVHQDSPSVTPKDVYERDTGREEDQTCFREAFLMLSVVYEVTRAWQLCLNLF